MFTLVMQIFGNSEGHQCQDVYVFGCSHGATTLDHDCTSVTCEEYKRRQHLGWYVADTSLLGTNGVTTWWWAELAVAWSNLCRLEWRCRVAYPLPRPSEGQGLQAMSTPCRKVCIAFVQHCGNTCTADNIPVVLPARTRFLSSAMQAPISKCSSLGLGGRQSRGFDKGDLPL